MSAKVLGAVGDPNRFLNGKQVLKLAGFDLSADRSAKHSFEICYILDPKDVYGPDFPGETLRVLKEKEEKESGEVSRFGSMG